jgi:hypothetical protein
MRTALNVALLLLLFGYASGLSAAQAEGSLTSFSFQLEDLDPNDGVTPSLTYLNNYRDFASSSVFWDHTPGPNDELNVQNQKFGLDHNSRVDLGFAGGHSSMDGGAAFATEVSGVQLSAGGNRTLAFALTQHTKVTFSGEGHARVSDVSGFSHVDASAHIYATLDPQQRDGNDSIFVINAVGS